MELPLDSGPPLLDGEMAPDPRIARKIEDLAPTRVCQETVLHLSGARVTYVDYAAVEYDFPWLKRGEIDQWLLENGALISIANANCMAVNTRPVTDADCIRVHRPQRYGRAVVRQVETGLLDLKGVGVAPDRKPVVHQYGTGLHFLHDAFQEVAKQIVINRALQHTGSLVRAIPIYAVLDTGIDIVREDGSADPAAISIRRAHARSSISDLPAFGSAAHHACFEIEMLLRCFGITSGSGPQLRIEERGRTLTAHVGTRPSKLSHGEILSFLRKTGLEIPFIADRVNIQTIGSCSQKPASTLLVDVEHYTYSSEFRTPVQSVVCDRPLGWGGVLLPNDPCFIRFPDQENRVHPHTTQFSDGASSATQDAKCLARGFRDGAITRDESTELSVVA